MKKKKSLQRSIGKDVKGFLLRHSVWICFGILLFISVFLQLFQLWERAHFGWDQVDVAWNAKKILVDNDFPVFGMIAKGNTGFHIGPGYYYLASIFYKITDLNPIASPLLASFSAIVSFCILFFVTRKIFSDKVALIAIGISVFSYYVLSFDKIQWPVNFIAPVSLLIFYSLYKIATGSPRYFLLLATMLGLSMHLHFTSVFYFILVIFTLPFIPRNKKTLLYAIYAIPLLLIWFLPFLVAILQGNNVGGATSGYLHASYHGLHVRRVIQLTRDAFIEFQGILHFSYIAYATFLFLPLFIISYLHKHITRERVVLCYLVTLWFLLPWIAFATYSGEISNYYFTMTRPLALIILAYLTWRVVAFRWYLGVLIAIFWIVWGVINMQLYFRKPEYELDEKKEIAEKRIKRGEPVELHLNAPEAYWQWYMQEYKRE